MNQYFSQTLFNEPVNSAPPAIPGLTYLPDFIDKHNETSLITIIDSQPWLTDLKRRVQHYGYRYDYKARGISPESNLGPLPEWLLPLCQKLYAEKIFARMPDQVIINEYQTRQGISSHIDCIPCFGATIASLSLAAPCVMDFTHSKTGEKQSRLLEPRSLAVFSDDARYIWQHSIAARKSDKFHGATIPRSRRVSLTFRTIITK